MATQRTTNGMVSGAVLNGGLGDGVRATGAGVIGWPRRRRRRGRAVLGVLAFPLLFCALFFGGSWLISPEPDVTASQQLALAELDGREVAVVAYQRSGSRGMLPLLTSAMFQSRLAAHDTTTGERVWDVRLNTELGSDMRVLAAADGLVYVASDEGLYIRSLADGSAVVEPDAIEGLGADYVAELGSYDYDERRRLVVAIDVSGGIVQLPVGETAATPADEETLADWRPVLSDAFRFALHLPTVDDTALVGEDAVIGVVPTAPGARSDALVLNRPSGSDTLGDSSFFSPQFVLDVLGESWETAPTAELPEGMAERMRESGQSMPSEGGYAAGATAGYVLVWHDTTANGDERMLSSVELASGRVIDTVDVGYEVGGGATRESTTALVASPVDHSGPGILVVAATDGTLRTFDIGTVDFLGLPH